MALSIRRLDRHVSPLSRRGLALRFLLLVAFLISGTLHLADAEAEPIFGQAQSEEIRIGQADLPCDGAARECEHQTHRDCTAASGCQFAALMPEAPMLSTDATAGLPALGSPFLKIGARTLLFHPPKSSVQA